MPVLSPHGVLSLKAVEDAVVLDAAIGARIEKTFLRGTGHGLLHLGADEIRISLPPALAFWREFAARYLLHKHPAGCEQALLRKLFEPLEKMGLLRSLAPGR
ncbi:MAG: hypothetical protein LBU72_03745 [Burkholderiaceae bacterium]|nr:hypothetical protein [Burkholderiaceae bacterium]